MPPPPPTSVVSEPSEDRTVAILGYLTLIGLIVAVILHGNKKTRLGAFHLRQSLGFWVTVVALGIAVGLMTTIPLIGILIWFSSMLLWLGMFILWLIGFVSAASGQLKPIPLLGEHYEKWLGNAFA